MEKRIFYFLGSIALGWHLLSVFGQFLGIFTDTLLLLFWSWILAFILDPIVLSVTKKGLPKIWAAVIIYLGITIFTIALVVVVLPTTVTQIAEMAAMIPAYLPADSIISNKIETLVSGFVTSLPVATSLLSGIGGIFLVFIFSFYILIARQDISRFILGVLPDEYKTDFIFLEKTINQTFAIFLRAQIIMGGLLGFIVMATLIILRVPFAFSTAFVSGILASVPVLGPLLFVIPVALATFPTSLQTTLIALAVIILAAQLVFNFVAQKILSTELKIHPLVVLLAFILGFKIGGAWGAIFGVPVTAAAAIILRDLIKHWKQEADK